MNSRKQTFLFSRPIVEVSAKELKETFGDVLRWDESGAAVHGIKDVTRAIVQNEIEFPSSTGIRDLRDIWYSTVKPVFSKLGMLRQPLKGTMSSITFMKRRSDKIDELVSEFVAEGAVTYLDMGIIDHSRDKQHAVDYTVQDLTGYPVAFGVHANLVLATEKNTQYAELERIAALYGCSVISGSGQGSLAAMEGLLRGIMQRLGSESFDGKIRDLGLESEIVFLPFTDYDGYGYSIADTFETHMQICLENANVRTLAGKPITVRTERLGINLDQMTPAEVENNKYELSKSDSVNKEWVAKYGGIGGEFYGLELNAMKGADRTKIITDRLGELIKPERYGKEIRDAYIRKIAIESISEIVNTALDSVVETEGKKLPTPEITPADIQALALDDETQFPIDVGDQSHDENIASKVIEVLAEKIANESN